MLGTKLGSTSGALISWHAADTDVPTGEEVRFAGGDWIVPAEGNVEALDQALTEAGNTDYEIVVIGGADHGLESPDDGYPPEYWETLLAWLVAVSETGTPR